MNNENRQELMAFVLDHVKTFGAMPMEFEDSSGKVWTYDEYINEIKNNSVFMTACNRIIRIVNP